MDLYPLFAFTLPQYLYRAGYGCLWAGEWRCWWRECRGDTIVTLCPFSASIHVMVAACGYWKKGIATVSLEPQTCYLPSAVVRATRGRSSRYLRPRAALLAAASRWVVMFLGEIVIWRWEMNSSLSCHSTKITHDISVFESNTKGHRPAMGVKEETAIILQLYGEVNCCFYCYFKLLILVQTLCTWSSPYNIARESIPIQENRVWIFWYSLIM